MPIYNYKCFECNKEFESIEKLNTELTYCSCGKLAKRIHGQDIPSPHLFYDITGTVSRPAFGNRRKE